MKDSIPMLQVRPMFILVDRHFRLNRTASNMKMILSVQLFDIHIVFTFLQIIRFVTSFILGSPVVPPFADDHVTFLVDLEIVRDQLAWSRVAE